MSHKGMPNQRRSPEAWCSLLQDGAGSWRPGLNQPKTRSGEPYILYLVDACSSFCVSAFVNSKYLKEIWVCETLISVEYNLISQPKSCPIDLTHLHPTL